MNKKVFIFLSLVILAECVSRQDLRTRKKNAKVRISRARSGTLEDLLNVYDPTFLAVVWPRITNGVHLFVETPCWDDLSVFFKQLALGRAWTYSAVDASGRYGSGLFKGNRYWLGSKHECLQLDNKFTSSAKNDSFEEVRISSDYLQAMLRRERNYDDDGDGNNGAAAYLRSLIQKDDLIRRLVMAEKSAPYRLSYVAVQLALNITKLTMAQAYSVTLGVCLPRSCSPEDVAAVINFSVMLNDNLKTNKTIPRVVKITSARQVNEDYDLRTDIGAIFLICITILLLMVAAVATAEDLNLLKCRTHKTKAMTFDLQKVNNNNLDLENKAHNDDIKNHNCDFIRKESNVVDMETLTINNINNSNNINLVTVKKMIKPNAMPPSITLDVVSMERVTGSCKRCGKYKKQCNTSNPRHLENLPACPRVKSFASLTTEPKRKDCLFRSLLLCFSLVYSWKRIFNTNLANKDLSLIHILRIIATFWVIFVHVAMIANYISDDGDDVNDRNNAYYIVITGTLAFDTLFFVSGLFSAHHFFFLKNQYTVEELVNFGGTCGQILQFLCFVTNRAIRLLPSYAYVIFLTGALARVTRDTAVLQLPDNEYFTCNNYWWRNLLYITNFFRRDDQCMQISWFLSVETQLHLLGVLACALSGCARRAVLAAGAAAALVTATADVGGSYIDFGHYLSSVYAAYSVFIERPLAQVTPYFLGMLAGWLVIRLEGKLHISQTKRLFFWLCSALGVLTSVASPWVFSEWNTSWTHPIWPLAMFWPALVSATTLAGATRNILEKPAVAALSRLCYSMLLLHGPVARVLLLSADTPLCSSTICIWWYYAGTVLVSVALSLLLSLLLETPCCSLLRRLSDYANW